MISKLDINPHILMSSFFDNYSMNFIVYKCFGHNTTNPMKMTKIIPVVMFACMGLTALGQGELKSGIKPENLNKTVSPAEDFYEFALKMSNLDQNVRPQDDFYEYACGGWMKNNPLPAAYSRFGSFDQLAKDNSERINNILNDLLKKNYAKGTAERKLSDLYKMAMDSTKRNADGVAPVK